MDALVMLTLIVVYRSSTPLKAVYIPSVRLKDRGIGSSPSRDHFASVCKFDSLSGVYHEEMFTSMMAC